MLIDKSSSKILYKHKVREYAKDSFTNALVTLKETLEDKLESMDDKKTQIILYNTEHELVIKNIRQKSFVPKYAVLVESILTDILDVDNIDLMFNIVVVEKTIYVKQKRIM